MTDPRLEKALHDPDCDCLPCRLMAAIAAAGAPDPLATGEALGRVIRRLSVRFLPGELIAFGEAMLAGQVKENEKLQALEAPAESQRLM